MKSLKSRGGLTGAGKGLNNEALRNQWLLSRPACAATSSAIQSLASVSYSTSDQHQEMYGPRLDADRIDFNKIYCFIAELEPFRSDPALINIVTGVEAGEHVTSDQVLSLGNSILNTMVGKYISNYKFSRKMAVKNMSTVLVKDKHNNYAIDSNILFQRLLSSIIIRRDEIGIKEVFSHELCTFPPRLFSSETQMLSSDSKSKLLKIIEPIGGGESSNKEGIKYFIDGGMLVHPIQ